MLKLISKEREANLKNEIAFQCSDGFKHSGKIPALIVVFSEQESQERDKCGPYSLIPYSVSLFTIRYILFRQLHFYINSIEKLL